MRQGKVYLVGAGPGDPELLTIKAGKCLEIADVILYDRLVNPDLLHYAKEGAELVYCGKTPGHHCVPQKVIQDLLLHYAQQGKIVVRLKGGDPFIFGRGGEEAEVLAKHHIEFEIIPGITAGIAAPAYAGIPVTHRELSRSFAIVTGHGLTGTPENIRWHHLAQGVDTLAIYMGVKNLPYICEQLLAGGKSIETPVAVIEEGTSINQRVLIGTLRTIVEIATSEQVSNPALIVVGEVVKQSATLSWFSKSKLQEVYA
ncbi:uroporphyrinogen-III C-methyltransferase [Priestia flexa]|uniref:uroporphyrinogen-III C-methyltransferase n=1 Tax=Priestia flexa TaxID=86664 RepID=UPI00099D0136|nr:uroporphyrinogen-III C-methyltransferase [Priestia flexa]AQX55745.1 uroporphyrinogen-III C-methyltransferase [Priestia flexa]